MSSSSSSTSTLLRNPKIFKVDLDGNIYCYHDIVAVLRVVGRKSVRNGQQFYGCSQWPGSDCKFFLWKEDVDKMFFKGQYNVSYEELKVKNLELKNLILTQENKKLRQNNSGTNKEKFIVLTLVVIIVVSLYLYN